jgi:hypothetical protein
MILNVLLAIFLLWIFIQDIKSRAIYWWLPLGALFIIGIKTLPIVEYSYLLINLVFVAIQAMVVFVYFALLKKQKVSNLVGLGDVLFLFIPLLAFSPFYFIAFFIVSLLLSLITHGVVKTFKKNAEQTIPLAGYMALHFLLLYLYSIIFKVNLYTIPDFILL